MNALAQCDEKPSAIVRGIAERQARLKEIDAMLDSNMRPPLFIESELEQVRQVAEDAVKNIGPTLEGNSEQAREVLRALFEKLVFNPVKTGDGPRFRIEGDAQVGKYLGVEGVEPVAVLNERPQGDSEVGAPDFRPIYEDFPHWLGGMTQEEAGLVVTLVAVA